MTVSLSYQRRRISCITSVADALNSCWYNYLIWSSFPATHNGANIYFMAWERIYIFLNFLEGKWLISSVPLFFEKQIFSKVKRWKWCIVWICKSLTVVYSILPVFFPQQTSLDVGSSVGYGAPIQNDQGYRVTKLKHTMDFKHGRKWGHNYSTIICLQWGCLLILWECIGWNKVTHDNNGLHCFRCQLCVKSSCDFSAIFSDA